MDIRRATEKDLNTLVSLDSMAAAGDVERQAYLARAVVSDVCLLAAENGAASGFLVLRKRHFFDRDFVDLLMIGVVHRRRGFGSALMSAALTSASTTDVFTSTNESNTAMRALLDAQGWSFSGRLDGLDKGDPELVFFTHRR